MKLLEQMVGAARAGAHRALLFGAALLPGSMPYRAMRTVTRFGHLVRRRWISEHADVVAHHLETTIAEAETVVRKNVTHQTFDELEGGLLRLRSRARISRLIEIRGLEHLDAALAEGKGAMLFSGHFYGHWVFQAALGLSGYSLQAIRQEPPPTMPRLDRWFFDRFNRLLEQRYGCRYIWMTRDAGVAVKAMNALRRNEIVIVLLDKSHSTQHLPARFFGGRLAVPIGPLLVAQALGTPMLGYGVHRREMKPIAEIAPPQPPSRDLAVMAQGCASTLERLIAKDPAAWALWLRGGWNLDEEQHTRRHGLRSEPGANGPATGNGRVRAA